MKIALLHMTMGLSSRGAEQAMDRLATGLSKKHEVIVYQSGPLEGKHTYKQVRIYPLSVAPPPAPQSVWDKIAFRMYWDTSSRQVISFTLAAVDILSDHKPDVVIAVNGASQVKIIRSSLPHLPIAVFGESGPGYHDRDTLRAKPDLFIALTEWAKEWAQRYASASTRIVVIPNPIPVGSKKIKKINLGLPHPIVITVGALTRYKNISAVIRAIRELNVSYILIGDGEMAEEVMSELSTLKQEFRWIKHVEPSELPAYYAAADTFCFTPDPQEAFGNVYIEAMTAGLPIVASDDPIRREVVGSQGVFVDPQSSDSIVAGIMHAVQKDKLDYAGELEKYQPDQVITQVEKELNALIR